VEDNLGDEKDNIGDEVNLWDEKDTLGDEEDGQSVCDKLVLLIS
jgi:hypothetical protein